MHQDLETMLLGEITIKGTRGAKVKLLFQGLHMIVSFLCWFIILNFVSWISHLTLHFNISIFWLQIDLTSCLLCIHALYHIYIWTTFVKITFSKSIIFRVKHFWTKCAQMGYKNNFHQFNPFAFLIINVKIPFNFQKEWCTFGRKKGCFKKTRIVHSQGLNALNMQKKFWFVSSFEHVNFAING